MRVPKKSKEPCQLIKAINNNINNNVISVLRSSFSLSHNPHWLRLQCLSFLALIMANHPNSQTSQVFFPPNPIISKPKQKAKSLQFQTNLTRLLTCTAMRTAHPPFSMDQNPFPFQIGKSHQTYPCVLRTLLRTLPKSTFVFNIRFHLFYLFLSLYKQSTPWRLEL